MKKIQKQHSKIFIPEQISTTETSYEKYYSYTLKCHELFIPPQSGVTLSKNSSQRGKLKYNSN